MKWSIRYRLILPLGLLLLSVVLLGMGSALLAAKRTEQRILGQVRSLLQNLGGASYPLTAGVLEQVKQLSGAEYLLVSENRLATLPELLPFDVKQSPKDEPESRVLVGNRAYLARGILLREPHRNAGASLYVFYPEDLLDDAIRDAVRPSLFGLGLGFLAVLFTFGLGQRLVGRIREIERRTRILAQGDFSPMPLPKPKDEIRDLAASINEMAAQLQLLQETVRRMERMRLIGQLSGGLAHQLRNNVTGAKLALQVHQGSHPEDADALEVVLRQLRLMDANLKRFIDLGREAPQQRRETSLRSVLVDVISLLRPQAEHLGIMLKESLGNRDYSLLSDPAQLTDLFLNLLTNAIEAAGPGGRVSLSFRTFPHGCEIEIADSGPGLAEVIRDRPFEPFTTTKPEGIGLGLAVARQAAERHGGTIDWRREGNETVFRVRLGEVGS